MPKRNLRHSSGLIDESLSHITTTLRINESWVNETYPWLREQIRSVLFPRPKIDFLFDRINNPELMRPVPAEEFLDENPEVFIGSNNGFADNSAAPKLPRQLVELGFVPRDRIIVNRRLEEYGRTFDLKIYWGRRDSKNDSEATAMFIEETIGFFFDWQVRYGWSIRGVEFLTNVRKVDLFFTGRHRQLPSDRWYEITIEEDPVLGTKRLVAI